MQQISNVCFDLTSKCNDHCKFCYRTRCTTELAEQEIIQVIAKLNKLGAQKISFVGGEPLTVDFLPEALSYSKSLGIKNSIVTNGLLLSEKLSTVGDNVDWITMPLDSIHDEELENMGRSERQFERIKYILPQIKEKNIKFKINSVLSQKNIHSFKDTFTAALQIDFDRWKIFRFFPVRGEAKKNQEHFLISDSEFQKTVAPISAHNIKNRTTIANWDYLQSYYFSISPDGNIRKSKGLHDHILGNILTDSIKQILQNFKTFN